MTKSICLGALCLALWSARATPAGAAPVNDERPIKDSAEVTSAGEDSLEWYTMFTRIPDDWLRYSRETFRWENAPAFVGMTVLTGALVATDEESWQLSHRLYQNSSFAHRLSDAFEYLGDGRPQFGLAGAFALYGIAWGDRRALRTGSQLVETILACGTVVQVLKHVTGRQSPFVSTRPGGVWELFPNQIQYHKHVPRYDAYPSGHIATAMATVTVVAENYPELTWVKPVGYSIVALIGFSMGNTGIHWYSDYPLGIALGYSFGMLAAHPDRAAREQAGVPHGTEISFGPVVTPQGAGIGMNVRF